MPYSSAADARRFLSQIRFAGTFLVAGALLAGAVLCAAAPASKSPAPPQSIVLITLDTTRADHLGAWGWPHARTPNLDALARRGTRFVRCDTAAPVTLPSHATILTGLFPPRHGVRDNGTFVLADRFDTVAERLAARGWDTAAVVSAAVLARRHGLTQGFRIYDDDLGAGYAAGTEVSERPADATTAAALAAAGQLEPPYFLWVHYFDPHEEYRPPTRFADAAHQAAGPSRLYDGEIAFMDDQIGKLLAGLPKDVRVVVVGDHGEMLGEHGEDHHGLLLYRGARRVPLLAAGPGIPAGRTEECLVRTADVAPTLLALAGAPVPAGLDGETLLGRRVCGRTSYSESFLPFFAYKWFPLRSLADDRFLYIYGPESSIYQLPSDPEEKDDLARQQPGALRLWEKRLRDLLRPAGETLETAMRPASPLSEEQRRQLASLGYAGGSSGGAVRPSLPDPRKMTDLLRSLHAATELVQGNKCPEALPALQEIVRRDPHNLPALNLTGHCLEEAGRIESALSTFQQAGRENELAAAPVANAARCLHQLGRREEAEKEYRRALALDPAQGEAAARLARMLREKGQNEEAVRVIDAALAAGSHEEQIYEERGHAYAALGKLPEALRDFRESARRNPLDPIPLENAAHAAYRLGQTRDAVQLYERLLQIQPNRLDAWKAAGAIYLYDLEDGENAQRCFRRALSLELDPAEREKLESMIREMGG